MQSSFYSKVARKPNKQNLGSTGNLPTGRNNLPAERLLITRTLNFKPHACGFEKELRLPLPALIHQELRALAKHFSKAPHKTMRSFRQISPTKSYCFLKVINFCFPLFYFNVKFRKETKKKENAAQ